MEAGVRVAPHHGNLKKKLPKEQLIRAFPLQAWLKSFDIQEVVGHYRMKEKSHLLLKVKMFNILLFFVADEVRYEDQT